MRWAIPTRKGTGILFQGEPGKPVAVLIAGGGFDGVAFLFGEHPGSHGAAQEGIQCVCAGLPCECGAA